MKKAILLFVVALLGFAGTISADNNVDVQKRLEQIIAEENKELPQEMDAGITAQQIYINDFLRMVMMQFTLTKEAQMTAKDIEAVGEVFRASMMAGMKQDPESKEFLDTAKKAGYGVALEFVDHLGNTAILITPNADL